MQPYSISIGDCFLPVPHTPKEFLIRVIENSFEGNCKNIVLWLFFWRNLLFNCALCIYDFQANTLKFMSVNMEKNTRWYVRRCQSTFVMHTNMNTLRLYNYSQHTKN